MHCKQIFASFNWIGAFAGVLTDLASVSALEATVNVSAALALPANTTAPQLTGHITRTADNTGLILESDLVIVGAPRIYILSFTLTDFPSVCPLASHTCSACFCTTSWASS